MANVIGVGAQWGDEGKGKLIDASAYGLIPGYSFDVTVRPQGGNNAGHTTVDEDNVEIILHLVPSAMRAKHIIGIMGNGMVIDTEVLVNEMKLLESHGIMLEDRLFISDRANIIMPYHRYLDGAKDARQGIGTTGKGIGPTYTDKAARQGIRFCDFLDGSYHSKIERAIEEHGLSEKFNPIEICEKQADLFARIKPYVCNTEEKIYNYFREGKSFLFECAQGTMLDVDHGTYPNVTSSNSIAAGSLTGSGFGPAFIDEVWGVAKAYITRVGNGSFPTELGGERSEKYCAEEGGKKYSKKAEKELYGDSLNDMLLSGEEFELGIAMRMVGGEYGATTGRPRRTGWHDAVILRHAVQVNGLTHLAITKLDVLTGLPVLKVCTAYEREVKHGDNGTAETIRYDFPPGSEKWMRECVPVYEELPGWKEDITGVTEFGKLPENAQRYVNRLEELAGVPVMMIGVGPNRMQTIIK